MTPEQQAAAVQEARRWIDTPFQHQGRLLGHGVDCIGVAQMAYLAAGVELDVPLNYSQLPTGKMVEFIAQRARRVAVRNIEIGDLLVFISNLAPTHVGVVTGVDPVRMVHAYNKVGRVVENSLDGSWKRLLNSVWRIN